MEIPSSICQDYKHTGESFKKKCFINFVRMIRFLLDGGTHSGRNSISRLQQRRNDKSVGGSAKTSILNLRNLLRVESLESKTIFMRFIIDLSNMIYPTFTDPRYLSRHILFIRNRCHCVTF